MFTADSRNLGGRNLIFSEIFNHRSHLSYINTYPIGLGFQKSVSPRLPAKNLSGSLIPTQMNRNKKVIIDTSPPKTFNLLYNRSKMQNQEIQLQEHSQNLLISRKKIEENRKKNEKDYILCPTYLFRRDTVSEQTLFSPSLSPQSKVGKRKKEKSQHVGQGPTDMLFRDPLLGGIRRRQQPQMQKLIPFSTVKLARLNMLKSYQIQLIMDQKNDSLGMQRLFLSSPWLDVSDQLKAKTAKELKEQIKYIIKSYGIYQAVEYEDLIQIVAKNHPHLPKQVVFTIFNDLIKELQMESF